MTAIEFEHVSKLYRLGLVSTGALKDDLHRFWVTKILKGEDPYLKIGETNDRSSKGTSDYVWALRDIDFKVEQGDVVGIIGKNGAGKSTLLKLLSRVTGPTTGSIRAHGRIGSLLEVGTGFHPEMTGRENIFMNGAILGMTHREIQAKLDEIVDFSGCERYIDTPVKRYSSGMTVRLGFAVAAHLDPEILVVDEVLAVGDAEFQKKAIGKMKDVSKGEGRTVLFVSHNMTSIGQLCNRCVLLENGSIKEDGSTNDVITTYLLDNYNLHSDKLSKIDVQGKFEITNFCIEQMGQETDELYQGDPFKLSFDIQSKVNFETTFACNFEVNKDSAESITCFGNEFQNYTCCIPENGKIHFAMDMNEMLLKKGMYYMSLFFVFFKGKDVVAQRYLEYAQKINVLEPNAIYMNNIEREWKQFPSANQHGNVASRVSTFNVENL